MYVASVAIDPQRVLHRFRVLVHWFGYAAGLPAHWQLHIDFVPHLEQKPERERESPVGMLEYVFLGSPKKTNRKQHTLPSTGYPTSDLNFILRHYRIVRVLPGRLVLEPHVHARRNIFFHQVFQISLASRIVSVSLLR